MNESVVLKYQIKAPVSNSQEGSARWNVSWDGKNIEEDSPFIIQTANYSEESHLAYDLQAVQKSEYPWSETRSIQPNMKYNFSLSITNIGDTVAEDWNISLLVPSACNVTKVYNSGSWDETNRKITWQLPDLNPKSSSSFTFTLNCTEEGSYNFFVEGIRNTTNQTSYSDSVSYSCTSPNCQPISHNFQDPEQPYEELSKINLHLINKFNGTNITLAESFVKIADDENSYKIFYQTFDISEEDRSVISNYTIDEVENFVNPIHNINMSAYVTGLYNTQANITISQIDYTWKYGKLFNETNELFFIVKTYTYTPLLENATLFINGDSSRTVGGWGEEFNFSVKVRDRFGRDVVVYAWHRNASGDSLIGSWTCSNCLNWQEHNFTYDYLPENIYPSWFFFFNASNADGSSRLDGYTYEVERDDINIYNYTPAPDAIVNRSSSSTFSVRAWDRDNNSYPTGSYGKIWIDVYTYQSYETSPSIITSDEGWINRSMSNSEWCSDESKWYLGLHSWYGGTSGDTYVKDNVTSPLNFTLKGDLGSSTMQAFNQNFTRGSTISFSGSVVDDCGNTQGDPTKFGLEFRMVKDGNIYGKCTTPCLLYTSPSPRD